MELNDVVVGETYMWDGTDGMGDTLEDEPRKATVLGRSFGPHEFQIDDGWHVNANSLSSIPQDNKED